MPAQVDAVANMPPVKFTTPINPGQYRIVKVDYRHRTDATYVNNYERLNRSAFLRLRGTGGEILFQRGGVVDTKAGLFLPSSIAIHQTQSVASDESHEFNRGYPEDATFFVDKEVSEIRVELYDAESGNRIKDGWVHLSLDVQTPEYIV